MANPYLIQALYGPKPMAPVANARQADNDQPTLEPGKLSLADKLYGREIISETILENHEELYTHPDQHNQDGLDGRWRATLAKSGSEKY
jgi:hypothetical protein